MKHFDAKIFNGEAFGKYVSIIPNTKKNELELFKAIKKLRMPLRIKQEHIMQHYQCTEELAEKH